MKIRRYCTCGAGMVGEAPSLDAVNKAIAAWKLVHVSAECAETDARTAMKARKRSEMKEDAC